ncbi:MAG: M28 family peptidase [Bacteroidales bacterium]|nr:M28 family peptidase [Bacteroidales bacterium]
MSEIITDIDANYAYDIVKKICSEVGPGLPGSPQEHARADLIKMELESHLGTDNVAAEEFTFAPGAFLSSYPICGLLMLFAALLNMSMGHIMGISPWLTSIAALTFSIIVPLPFIFEFVLAFELFDPLFRKRKSVNVIGRLRKPGTKNVKRLLIISGHHDSAPENTWLRFLGYGFFILLATFFIGYIIILVMSIIQLLGMITDNASLVRTGTIGWIMMAWPIVPAVVFAIFFTRKGKNGGNVPGAADNLSASALAVALCRFLVKNPSCIPADTEIRFISFGGEEAGCRGSRRYVKSHFEELKRLDARLLNIETVASPEIFILTSDVNGTVKNSPEMVKCLVAAAERAGIPFKVKPATLGTANDSGPFSQAGLKATTLLAFKIPQQMVAFYHQKWDRPEILTMEPLLNVLNLTLDWIKNDV